MYLKNINFDPQSWGQAPTLMLLPNTQWLKVCPMKVISTQSAAV